MVVGGWWLVVGGWWLVVGESDPDLIFYSPFTHPPSTIH
jgi:hypothetical protein